MTKQVRLCGVDVEITVQPVHDFWHAHAKGPDVDVSATGETEGSAVCNVADKVEAALRKRGRALSSQGVARGTGPYFSLQGAGW